MKLHDACLVIVTACAVLLTFFACRYLHVSQENGRYQPHDVRNEHYGWQGGSVNASGTNRVFDTRTGQELER